MGGEGSKGAAVRIPRIPLGIVSPSPGVCVFSDQAPGKMRSQCQTHWHRGINLISFKQKSMAAKSTRIVPFRQHARSTHARTHTHCAEEAEGKVSLTGSQPIRSRPHSPEDILPQCSALWELSARVPLVQALRPVRQASSPEPPPPPPGRPRPWSLAALSARGSSQSGRGDRRSGQRPRGLCGQRGFRQAGRRGGGRCTVFSVDGAESTVPHAQVVLLSFLA